MVFLVTACKNLFCFLFGRIYSEYAYLFGIGRSCKKEDANQDAAHIRQFIRNVAGNGNYVLDPFPLDSSCTHFETQLFGFKFAGKIKFCGNISGLKTLKQADFCSLTAMDGVMRVNSSLTAGPLHSNSWVIVQLFGFKHAFFIKGTLSHVKLLCDFIVSSNIRTSCALNYLLIREVDGMELLIKEGLGLLKWPVNLAVRLVVNFYKPFIRNATECLLENRIKKEFPHYEFQIEESLKETSLPDESHEVVSDVPQITKSNASKFHSSNCLNSVSSDLKKKPPVGFKDDSSNSELKAEEVKYKPVVMGGKTFNLSMMYIRISMSKNILKLRRISETEYKARNAGNTGANEFKTGKNFPSFTASHAHKISVFQSAMKALKLHGYSGVDFKKYYDEASRLAEDLEHSSDTLIYVGSLLCLELIENYMRDEGTGDLLNEVELSGDRRIQFIKQYNEIGKLVEEIKRASIALKQVCSLFCRIAMERYMADESSTVLDGSGHKATLKSMELADSLPVPSLGQGCMTEKVRRNGQDNQMFKTDEISSSNSLVPDLLKDASHLKDFDFCNKLTLTEKSTTNENINFECLEKYFPEIVSNPDSTLGHSAIDQETGTVKEATCDSEPTFVDSLVYSSMMPKCKNVSADEVERNSSTRMKVTDEKVPVVEETRNVATSCKVKNTGSFEDKELNVLDIKQDKALIESMENLDQILNRNKVLLLKSLKVLEDLNKTVIKPGQENPLLVDHKSIFQSFASIQKNAVEEFVKNGGDCERVNEVNELLESSMQFPDYVDEAVEKCKGVEGTGGQTITKHREQYVNSDDSFVDLLFYSSIMPKPRKPLVEKILPSAEETTLYEPEAALVDLLHYSSIMPKSREDLTAVAEQMIIEAKVAGEKFSMEEMESSTVTSKVKVTTEGDKVEEILDCYSTTCELEAELANGDIHRNIHQSTPFRLYAEDFVPSKEITTKPDFPVERRDLQSTEQENIAERKKNKESSSELETAFGAENINENLPCKAETEHTNKIPEISLSDEMCSNGNLSRETEMTTTCESEASCEEEYAHAKLPFKEEVETVTATNESVDATSERDSKEQLLLGVDGVSYKKGSALRELPSEAEIEHVAAINKSIDVTADGDAKEKSLQVAANATCEVIPSSEEKCAQEELPFEAEIDPVAANKTQDVTAETDRKEKLLMEVETDRKEKLLMKVETDLKKLLMEVETDRKEKLLMEVETDSNCESGKGLH